MKEKSIQLHKSGTKFEKNHRKQLSDEHRSDPIAKKVSWQPMSWTSLPYRSHVLQQESQAICFVPSGCAKTITGVYCGLGIIITTEGIFEYAGLVHSGGAPLFPTIVGAFILIFGLINYSIINRKIQFNANEMVCLMDYRIWKKSISTESILGLQLVPVRIHTDDYICNHFELIMVTGKQERILLVSHNSTEHLRSDAKELANFLKAPLWDGT